MRVVRKIRAVLAALALTLLSVSSFAQSGNANPAAFGIGFPERVEDLPRGAFRTSLQALSPQARGKAMQTLRKFQFTELDLAYIKVDSGGGVYFADVFLQEAQTEVAQADIPFAESITESEIFLLHSRPGATNKIFLDFDGHNITATAWNSEVGDPETFYPKAYDPSGDDTVTQTCSLPGTPPLFTVNFSAAELADIGEIWHRTAEDFAPFNVDVTTQDPGTFNSTTGRILYTQDVDYCGQNMPSCCSAGGVAYVGVYGASNYHTYYSPALVYFNKLGSVQSRHEAGSHEMGHNLSLGHDGTSGQSYYLGHGADSDLTSWAPIMGAGYYKNVTQWSKGDYPDATLYGQGGCCYQATTDDLLHIAGILGYRSDDHGDTIATATALTVQLTGTISVTNPETDPHDFSPENKGVIEDRTDLDYFYFDTGAGSVNITIEPAWAAFYRASTRRGANLDISATLYDGTAAVVDSHEPTNDTDAVLSATVAAGRYYIAIDGVGNAGDGGSHAGYDDYGSIGMYFISGTVQPPSADTDPPTPSPMTWAVEPYSIDSSSIGMTATTATDITGPVQYNFACVTGGGGCTDSGWQTASSHTATGLDASTAYSYTVQARDAVLNLTLVSAQKSATTDPAPPAAPSNLVSTLITSSSIDISWTDVASDETAYKVERSPNGTDTWTVFNLPANSTTHGDTGLSDNTIYYYRISASNAVGSSAYLSGNFTTLPLAPNGDPDTLAATPVSTSQIDLSWADNSSNEDDFEIQRSLDGSNWGVLTAAIVAANATTYSDTGLNTGTTYYYRIRARNGGGNSSFSTTANARTDYECNASKSMPANQWVSFSIPCTPPNPQVSSAFSGGLPPGDYDTTWVIFIYDNAVGGGTAGFRRLVAGDTLEVGKGYFYYANFATTMEMAGNNNTVADIPLRTDLANGVFNLVGNPHNGNVSWADVLVIDGTKPAVTLSKFDELRQGSYACDPVPLAGNTKCLMWRQMNQWETSHYQPYIGTAPDIGNLAAFDAVWVRAHKSGIELRIPTPVAAAPNSLQSAPVSEGGVTSDTGKPANKGKGGSKKDKSIDPWYVQLIAESGLNRDDGNRLGQLSGVQDGLDPRDLEEWTPYSSPYLSILFTNPLFDVVDWGYTTDYRELTANQQGDWPFVVRASADIDSVTLSWQGDTALFDNAVLINEVSGETIAIVAGGSYTFNISGGEHAFRIVFN